MRTSTVSVEHLVNNNHLGFSDSEGMIEDKRIDGKISYEEYNELFESMSSPGTKQKVLDWKLDECSDDFIESVVKLGIRNPVAVCNGEVVNGHHRIAVAQYLNIEVPVDFYDSWAEFDTLHKWEVPGLVDCFGDRG